MTRLRCSCAVLSLLACVAPAALPAQTLTFAAPKTIKFTLPDSAGATHFSAADFNGDGKMDYLLEAWNQGDLLDFALLVGNGSGSFTTEETNVPVPANATGSNPEYLVADVNNDGKADIITLQPGCTSPCTPNNKPGVVKVYVNQGSGRFVPTWTGTLPPNMDVISYAVADFNGDGRPDFAVLSSSDRPTPLEPKLTIFLNQQGGLFTEQNDANLPNTTTVSPSVVGNIVAGNFIVKGRNDLVFSYITNNNGNTPLEGWVYILPNNGKGSFGTPELALTGAYGDFVPGDLNGDGLTDLFAIDPSGSRNLISLLAKAGGKFAPGPVLHYTLEFWSQDALADLNGDGRLDLVLDGEYNSQPPAYGAAYLGNGNGSFNTSYHAFHPTGPWTEDPLQIAPLVKGNLPSIMFQTGSNSFELYVNTTK